MSEAEIRIASITAGSSVPKIDSASNATLDQAESASAVAPVVGVPAVFGQPPIRLCQLHDHVLLFVRVFVVR